MSINNFFRILNSLFVLFEDCISWFETLLSKTHSGGIFLASFAIYTATMLFLKPFFGIARDQAIKDFFHSDSSSRKYDDKVMSDQQALPPGR